MNDKYSVVRIKTDTLEYIRKLAAENDVSVPEMIDVISGSYEYIVLLKLVSDRIDKQLIGEETK